MNNEEVKEIEDLCAMVFIKWHEVGVGLANLSWESIMSYY